MMSKKIGMKLEHQRTNRKYRDDDHVQISPYLAVKKN